MTYGTGTITGTYLRFGTTTPAAGTVRIIPNVPAVRDTDGHTIMAGILAELTLDDEGTFTIEVPATDDPNLDPQGFAYNVVALLEDATPLLARGIQLSDGDTVNVIDWTDVNPAPPSYSAVGPAGPAGATGPQGPPGSGVSDAFEHNQTAPSSSWVIAVPVSLGRRPTVAVYVAGELVEADVTATSTNVNVQFPTPTAGTAVLT